MPAAKVSAALAAYGQWLYEVGSPVSHLTLAILAVTEAQRAMRGHLHEAWDAVRAWEPLLPASNRAPFPLPPLRAIVALASMRGWLDASPLLIAGFSAMLRPSEMLALRWLVLLTPAAQTRAPKNWKRAAQREHVRITDPLVVSVCSTFRASLPRCVRLAYLTAPPPSLPVW